MNASTTRSPERHRLNPDPSQDNLKAAFRFAARASEMHTAEVIADLRGWCDRTNGDEGVWPTIMTELVQNAIAASPAGETITIELLRVGSGGEKASVTSCGPSFELRNEQSGSASDSSDGYGLKIVNALADSLRVERNGNTNTVIASVGHSR